MSVFVTSSLVPLPPILLILDHAVLDVIFESTKRMHNADMNSSNHSEEVKRLSKNCFSEALRCISQIRQLLRAIEAFGINTVSKFKRPQDFPQKNVSYPAYISIDLGLRQRRNHFSGRLYFQALLLQNDFFRSDGDDNVSRIIDGKGTRIAEGGRYDNLVRQVRFESPKSRLEIS